MRDTPDEYEDQPRYRDVPPPPGPPPRPDPHEVARQHLAQAKAKLAEIRESSPHLRRFHAPVSQGPTRDVALGPVTGPPGPPERRGEVTNLGAVRLGDEVFIDDETGWLRVVGLDTDPPVGQVGILFVGDPEQLPELFPADTVVEVIRAP